MYKLTPLKWFVILTVIAVALALALPPDPRDVQQLHTTTVVYRLAVAALLIPYVIIWYASFYAFAKLREYSAPLAGTIDGEGFKKISAGMGVLSFALVVPTIVSLILNSIALHHPAFEAASVVINNYMTLYPGLVAFVLIFSGARILTRSLEHGVHQIDVRWHIFWFLLLAVLFSHLTIDNHYKTQPYHMDLLVLIITYIVPYLYAWAVGLLSSYELRLYSKTVNGTLYRSAIKLFALGIMVTVAGSIAIQFVNVTLLQRAEGSLGSLLLLDYALVSFVAVGLALIALGTKKLKRLEEV
jgi:hypothetical protein